MTADDFVWKSLDPDDPNSLKYAIIWHEGEAEKQVAYLQDAMFKALHSSPDAATDILRIALTHTGINPDTGNPYAED